MPRTLHTHSDRPANSRRDHRCLGFGQCAARGRGFKLTRHHGINLPGHFALPRAGLRRFLQEEALLDHACQSRSTYQGASPERQGSTGFLKGHSLTVSRRDQRRPLDPGLESLQHMRATLTLPSQIKLSSKAHTPAHGLSGEGMAHQVITTGSLPVSAKCWQGPGWPPGCRLP